MTPPRPSTPRRPGLVRGRLGPLTRCCAPRGASRIAPEAALRFARLFRALGDETRLEILGLLAVSAEPVCACEIETNFRLSQPTISHHLRVLREAGLVTAERRGLWIHYALDRSALADLETVAERLG